MKKMRYFLSSCITLQLLMLFPIYSRAEIIENPPAAKQEDNALAEEQSMDTEIGHITVSTTKAIVGETIHIAIEPKGLSTQKLLGWLRLSKTEQQYEQERQLSFIYDEEMKQWTANYTVSPYDLEGNWQLDVRMLGDGEPIEQEVNLVQIENKEPLPDKEGPKLEEFLISDHPEGTIEMKKGESLTVHAKGKDAASAVKQATVRLEGKEINFSFPLQYDKKEDSWIGTYEITEAIPVGVYKLMIELVDAAGNTSVTENQYVVSVVEEQETTDSSKEQPKEQKQQEEPEVVAPSKEAMITITEPSKQEQHDMTHTQAVEVKEKPKAQYNKEVAKQKKEHVDEKKEEKKQQAGVQASDLFTIISGGFLLFFILKSNKDWDS
ncbi:hypothetical protein COE51_04070 [Bacillus pseudomycoides]|nr:hypothetical protein COE51_04070 [Bacillus pseudomycoides]